MKLWLDLEIREDIDDIITFFYGIETNKNITEISINNPTILELKFLKYYKNYFNLNFPIIYSGNVLYSKQKRDINKIFIDKLNLITIDIDNDIIEINKYLENINEFDRIIFCGGSYTNLNIIQKKFKRQNIVAYLQGGYAGESFVGVNNTLDKFKGKEKVPSFNPNMDYEATLEILNSNNITKYFISKNVCHSSFMNQYDFKNQNSLIYITLINYFKDNQYNSKCMHDLVAFESIFNKDFITFKNCYLKSIKDNKNRIVWYSEESDSNICQISISLDMNKFKEIINNNLNKNILKKEIN